MGIVQGQRGEKMSGGSYNYIGYMIQNELCGQMEDPEVNDLMEDIAELALDLEWYHSDDIGQDDYLESLKKFKTKWFGRNRNKRLEKYIVTANNLHTETILRLLNLGED